MKKNTFNSKCVFLQMPVTLTVFKVALGSPAAYLIYLLNLLSWTRHLKSPTAIYLDQVFLGWKRNYSFQWLEMTNQDLKSSKLCSYLGKEHTCWGTTDYPECSRNQEETKVDRENEREKWAESCDQSIWDLVVRQWGITFNSQMWPICPVRIPEPHQPLGEVSVSPSDLLNWDKHANVPTTPLWVKLGHKIPLSLQDLSTLDSFNTKHKWVCKPLNL